ncbi:hypothetical protein [Schumannella sp. 10F1B-5-1]|uniref:hypothetical protein n=1 Tax=Schumannella sp. 10F1B-5-1 TaxID=2590780 RepID=UPI0011311973|nr:hypothetical protein [Schumannella sp. 10F1B-5-1]TPW70090.1 hypothetical protein FJ658_13755 [Schumannella sp. 10F1B-5-1]
MQVVPLAGRRWRVTRGQGQVLGYVDQVDVVTADGAGSDAAASRWQSRRMRAGTAQMTVLGEFDSPGDALDMVRWV